MIDWELYHHLKLTIDKQASPENPLVEGLGKKPVKMDNWWTEIGVPALTFSTTPNVSTNTAWNFDKNYWTVGTVDFAVLLCMQAVICEHSCLNLGNAETRTKQEMGIVFF